LIHFVVVVVVEDFLAFNAEEEDLRFNNDTDVWDNEMVFMVNDF